MRCKCKNQMTALKLDIGHNQKMLINYCMICGRAFLTQGYNVGSWYQSQKSSNPNLINRAKLNVILDELQPDDTKSVRNKAKIEILDKIRGEVAKLPKS